MPYDPQTHHRRSIRLSGYDYAIEGAYFITICAENKECLFGCIRDGIMIPNAMGKIIQACWLDLPKHFRHVDLDAFALMPNHMHGIVVIRDRGEALAAEPRDLGQKRKANASPLQVPTHGTKPQSVAAIVQNLKSVSSRRINRVNRTPSRTVWQRNYYEHIIRSEKSLAAIRQYIEANPTDWLQDPEYVNP